MFIDLVLITNFFVITSALKISGEVFGTDIACTVFITVLVAVHQFSLISIGQIEFKALVSPIGKELSANLIRVKLFFDYLGFLTYLLCVIIPSLVCLGLDKSKDPITNGEFIIVILRNIFVIFWSFGEGVAVQMVQKRAHLMLANSNNIASSPQNQKLPSSKEKSIEFPKGSRQTLVLCIRSSSKKLSLHDGMLQAEN